MRHLALGWLLLVSISSALEGQEVEPVIRARADQFVAMMNGDLEPDRFIAENMSPESQSRGPGHRMPMIFGVLQRFYRGEPAEFRSIRRTSEGVVLELSNVENNWAEYELLLEPESPDHRFGGFNARILGVRAEDDWKNLFEKDLVDRLRSHVEQLRQSNEFSGALRMTRGQKVLFETSGAITRTDRFDSSNSVTSFPVASVSKSFTAAAIWILVDRGLVDLDSSIESYVPDLSGVAIGKASLREILEHRSGLQSFTLLDETTESLPRSSLEDLAMAYSKLPMGPSGKTVYSNAGAVLLGWMIEKVTGLSFEDFMQRELFGPAGMEGSAFLPGNSAKGEISWAEFDEPHSGDRASTQIWFDGCVDPSKSALANPADLHIFAEGIFTGQLVEDRSLRDLMERGSRAQGEYANGLRIRRENGVLSLGHSGGLPGVAAQWWYFPESGYGIFVTSDQSQVAAGIADRVRTAISFRNRDTQ